MLVLLKLPMGNLSWLKYRFDFFGMCCIPHLQQFHMRQNDLEGSKMLLDFL